MPTIVISKLDSFEDVFDIVENELSKFKKVLSDSSEEVFLSINDLGLGIINLSALTMLTCLLAAVRKTYEYPFIGYFESHKNQMFYHDQKKAAFLKEIGFIDLTQINRIIHWDIPLKIPELEINPNTYIQQVNIPEISPTVCNYYSPKDYFNQEVLLLDLVRSTLDQGSSETEVEYENIKTKIKNEIKRHIKDDISALFTNKEGKDLEYNVISYAAEVLLNSFIHGRVNPFFAIQRTKKKITVTISDDGIGLVQSYKKLHGMKINGRDAVLAACKHRKVGSYGLYDVIHSVLGFNRSSFVMSDSHHGFVTISDGPYILLITRNNFANLIENPERLKDKMSKSSQTVRGVRIALDILIR